MNQTLAIIKPDATGNGKAGLILAHLESAGFTLRAARMLTMTDAQAGSFYAVHRERPFRLPGRPVTSAHFPMSSKAWSVLKLREVSGPDPAEAASGTAARADADIQGAKTPVHGSDSDENAPARSVFFSRGRAAG